MWLPAWDGAKGGAGAEQALAPLMRQLWSSAEAAVAFAGRSSGNGGGNDSGVAVVSAALTKAVAELMQEGGASVSLVHTMDVKTD